jgi:hypothetical protein
MSDLRYPDVPGVGIIPGIDNQLPVSSQIGNESKVADFSVVENRIRWVPSSFVRKLLILLGRPCILGLPLRINSAVYFDFFDNVLY